MPAFPTNIRVTKQTVSSIDFAWDDTTGATQYFTTISTNFTSQSFANATYSGLMEGTSYNAIFIANNDAGNGTMSSYETATGAILFFAWSICFFT